MSENLAHNVISDGSLGVLLFVCLPLILLLVGLIIALVRSSRRSITCPTFSLAISKVGPYETYLSYTSDSMHLHLDAELRRGRNFFVPEIWVRIPSEMSGLEQGIVIPNIALGLSKLGYQYVIYRASELQEVPEDERNAAVTELRQMGVELQRAPDGATLRQAIIRDWRSTVGKRVKTELPKLLRLMNTARGTRENIQVLAQSNVKR